MHRFAKVFALLPAQEWARAAYQARIQYYPKILVGVPFTPAAGARILVSPSLGAEERRRVQTTVAMFLR